MTGVTAVGPEITGAPGSGWALADANAAVTTSNVAETRMDSDLGVPRKKGREQRPPASYRIGRPGPLEEFV